jgi:hypothetical protein
MSSLSAAAQRALGPPLLQRKRGPKHLLWERRPQGRAGFDASIDRVSQDDYRWIISKKNFNGNCIMPSQKNRKDHRNPPCSHDVEDSYLHRPQTLREPRRPFPVRFSRTGSQMGGKPARCHFIFGFFRSVL